MSAPFIEIHSPSQKGTKCIGEYDILFLLESPSLKKTFYALPVLLKLAKNHDINALKLFIKGAANSLKGKKPTLSHGEYVSFMDSVVGTPPLLMHIRPVDIKLKAENIENFFDIALFTYQIIMKNQYNLDKGKLRGKIVVDAGANLGVFSLYAAANGAKKVYAFEPVSKTFKKLRENIRLSKSGKAVVPLNMAVGDRSGKVSINYSRGGDGAAAIGRASNKEYSETVRIVSLDEFFSGKGVVDIIKMDVEGYEQKVLLGARKTISLFKPILTFSAYHKPEDKVVLPMTIKKIRSDYKCMLISKADEDFYCD